MSKITTETFNFYEKTFHETYPKFINTLQQYAKKYGIEMINIDLENMTQEQKCYSIMELFRNLGKVKKNDDDKLINVLSNSSSFSMHKINMSLFWNKINKKEKKKIQTYIKLLYSTAEQLMFNAEIHMTENINVYDGINNNGVLTVEDMQKNLDITTSENSNPTKKMPGIALLSGIINKTMKEAGLNKSNITSFFESMKNSADDKDFNNKLHDSVNKCFGDKIYDPEIKSVVDDFASIFKKNIKNIDMSKIQLDENDFSAGLVNAATTIFPEHEKFANKHAKSLSKEKALDLMSTLLNSLPSFTNK